MRKKQAGYIFAFLLIILSLLAGCAPLATAAPTLTASPPDPSPFSVNSTNWNEASHGNDAEPNYEVVFPQETVNRIDIVLSQEAWLALQTEMEDLYGEAGQKRNWPDQMFESSAEENGPFAGQPPMENAPPLPEGNGFGQRPENGGFAINFSDTSYVPSTITFNGETWESVGFRYSGNSTLQSSWRNETKKISFRLDFDEYEDQDPSITNQRFYGFKQLSFKSNAMDSSYLREKITADIFREAGIVASQTAFYEVYIDYGEGSQYFGLYTVVEIVEDTVIETQFSDDSGNVYKPEGSGAAFVDGTFSTGSFEKQSNQEEADWSDIVALFSALNSSLRSTDPAAWRTELEAVFDVDAFIRWLAANTIIQNWDTYGTMAHNYYLYANPENGLLTWIPWDNNMALSGSPMVPGDDASNPESLRPGNNNQRGNRGANGPNRSVHELDLRSVGEQWPLIRFLMDDPVYLAKYRQYLSEIIQEAFVPEKLAAAYQKYHDLIAPYVQKETEGYTQLSSISSFNKSVTVLSEHAQSRYDAVVAYLAEK